MARSKNATIPIGGAISSSDATGARRSSRAEEIADRIQELIVVESLDRGARLPSERDLAELLGTSRPTVSQAMRILVVKGLVESRLGSGAYVLRRPQDSLTASVDLMASLDRGSLPELVELRLWLETTGSRRAVEVATEEEINDLERLLEELTSASGDVATFMTADTQFHSAVVGASHNSYLASIYESVHITLINHEYRAWIASGTTPIWLQDAAPAVQQLHAPIVRALEQRDSAAMERAIQAHHEQMAQHLRQADAGP